MNTHLSEQCTLVEERDAAVGTWFGVGGRADRLIRVHSETDALRALEMGDPVRVLGDGANLLVDDDGVGGIVLDLKTRGMSEVEIDAAGGSIRAGAGANLPKLILEACRAGLAGLEGLGGIPATVGGAARMNAGGAFGEIGPRIRSVRALDPSTGRIAVLDGSACGFGYRHSALGGLIILSVEFSLAPGAPATLRERLKETMAYKKASQPMSADSAGCVFKNPTLPADIRGVGARGERVGAGLLIDRAGCKGLTRGGAEVSERHANFIVTQRGASARDVITLMRAVRARVFDAFGVPLAPEVVIWSRHDDAAELS